MRSFFSLHIILGVGKQQDLENEFYQTVGDAHSYTHSWSGMKTVRIFSDRIRHRIRLERFRSVRIRVLRIRILKSYIYDVDIQSYLIQHDWHYPYSNPNSTKNMKINIIYVISVRIRSVFIPTRGSPTNSSSKILLPFDSDPISANLVATVSLERQAKEQSKLKRQSNMKEQLCLKNAKGLSNSKRDETV